MTHFLYTNRITFEYEVWCIEYMSHLDTNYNNLININNCNVLYFSATKEMINCPVGTYNPNPNLNSFWKVSVPLMAHVKQDSVVRAP